MTPHTKVKWGILSTSTTAVGKAIPALKRCVNAEVIAIASRDLEKARRHATSFGIGKAYGSYDALLENREVDAIYLPLPNGLHAQWTMRAAQAGKHVLCEKPAALSPQEARKMVSVCTSNNVFIMEGFSYRFHPQFECVKQWLAEGRIGRVLLLRITFSFTLEERHSKVRLQRSLGGGALADLGVYGIDLSRSLTGSEPTRVFASGSRSLGADVETNFVAILEFPTGMRMVLDGAFELPRNNRCEIVGQSGAITITSPFIPVEPAVVRIQATSGDEDRTFPAVDHFKLEFEYFSSCVLKRQAPASSSEDIVSNARVLAALRASLDAGCPLDVIDSPSLHNATIVENSP